MIPVAFPPPMIQTQIQAMTLPEAVEQVLQDFDAEDPALPLRYPMVRLADQPSLRWLRSAAMTDIPNNPFRKGSASFVEAEALLALVKTDQTKARTIETLLAELKVREPGTALALWRWAKRLERSRPWSPGIRRIWEGKLMARSVPPLLNGNALRHALCWALAEKDEKRFVELKTAWGQDSPSILASFQGLFGRFGEISPELRLWKLPGLEYQDRRMDSLLAFDGGKPSRIWISQDIGSVSKIPPGTVWIVPSITGTQNINETNLAEIEQSAGTAIEAIVALAKGQAYFAPCRTDFETIGLVFFPILIELDPKGAIKDIRMGDAAPTAP